MLLTLVHCFNSITLASPSVSQDGGSSIQHPSIFHTGSAEGKGRRYQLYRYVFIKKTKKLS